MTALAQTPNYSAAGHCKTPRIGPLQVKAANDILTAKAFNAMVLGTPFVPTTAKVIGLTGRNLRIIITDANNSETGLSFLILGKDQFNNDISERFPTSGVQNGAGTIVGKKIFTSVTSITEVTNTGDQAAADSITIGSGDKVGLPALVSRDLHEILDAELNVANQATAPAKVTVSVANIDVDYMALDFTAFGAGNVVVAGDSVQLRCRSDCLTPDDLSTYPTRA